MAKKQKSPLPKPARITRTRKVMPVSPEVPADIEGIFDRVARVLDQARAAVVRSVNNHMVLAYWHIGREIVTSLQGGDHRAEYGQHLIDELSLRLTARYSRGFSPTNLRYFRTFHQVYAGRTPEIRHIGGGESGSEAIRHTASGTLEDLLLSVEGQDAERGFSPVLGWSHYRALMTVENRAERVFYEIE